MPNTILDAISTRLRSLLSFSPREHQGNSSRDEDQNFRIPEIANLSLSQALYFGPHFVLSDDTTNENSLTRGAQATEGDVSFNASGQLDTCSQESSCTVFQSSLNLKHSSMNLIRTNFDYENGGIGNKYSLEFVFDSLYPCKIKLYWCAKEIWADEETGVGYTLKYPSQIIQSFDFPQGLNQKFSLPCDQLLDVTKFQVDDLVLDMPRSTDLPKPEGDQDIENDTELELKEPNLDSIVIQDATSSSYQTSVYYPLIIVLEAVTVNDKIPDILSTFATLTMSSGGTYAIHPLKQKIKINGVSFILQEIYGYSESDSFSNTPANEDNTCVRECVICMSDPRDTVVLPCRHMCLCKECAEVLRCQSSKCPICRQPFHSLLYVGLPEEPDANSTEIS